MPAFSPDEIAKCVSVSPALMDFKRRLNPVRSCPSTPQLQHDVQIIKTEHTALKARLDKQSQSFVVFSLLDNMGGLDPFQTAVFHSKTVLSGVHLLDRQNEAKAKSAVQVESGNEDSDVPNFSATIIRIQKQSENTTLKALQDVYKRLALRSAPCIGR